MTSLRIGMGRVLPMTSMTSLGRGMVILVLLLAPPPAAPTSVELYKGDEVLSLNCDVDLLEPFSCFCLQPGIWRVYSSCSAFRTMVLRDRACFNTREEIRRLERIGRDGLSPTLIGPTGSREFQWEALQVRPGDSVLSKEVRTVSDGTRSLCLTNQTLGQHCLFSPGPLRSILTVERGCGRGSQHVGPKDCFPYVRGLPDCTGPDLVRSKRMFLPWAVNVTDVADARDALEDDEDYYLDDGAKKSSLPILTEIWNYLDRQTDLLLGLRPTDYTYSYVVPLFQVLHLTGKVFKKTCPSWYVQPAFIDLSLNSFVQLLRKRRFFTEYGNQFEGMERIKEALLKCEANLTAFPFSQFQKDPCNKTILPTGHYELYGEKDEMTIHENHTSWNHEPIIDTVWKVFYNAHQYCFPFFGPHFNDHHRFGVVMETLFQNSIYDIWMGGETRNELFGGFLGQLVETTDRVSYCAMTGSLETEYPWDVPRPLRDLSPARRRRSIPGRSSAARCVPNGGTCTDIPELFPN